MRIGIFGGTFNPIHKGHIAAAEAAKEELALDKVIFMPAYIPPHKDSTCLIEAEDRMKMVDMAVSGRDGFTVSRFEIDKKDTSYSIDTLRYLKGSYPKAAEFFFIIGADSLAGLDKWKERNELFKLCKFCVCPRQGSKITNADNIRQINMEPLNISSTDIRKKIKTGKEITGLVPNSVAHYIKNRNLYK